MKVYGTAVILLLDKEDLIRQVLQEESTLSITGVVNFGGKSLCRTETLI